MNRSVGIRCEHGFTITEALVTLLVFSFFLAVLFVTMAYGFRTFSVAVARSDVTTEARRLVLFMEGELRTSAYFSVTEVPREVNGLARDGLCFVSMLDWSKPDSYNRIKGRPNWDRYLLYYATKELPSGRLVRVALNPQKPADVGSYPYPPFAANPGAYMLENPLDYGKGANEKDLGNTRVLASKVKTFDVQLIPTTQEVEVRTLLRQNGIMSRRGDKNREGGTFELQYRVHPQNSK
jgi:hypothetical protein